MKRLISWLKSLPWERLLRNAKTTFFGAVAFISFLASQQSAVLPFIPADWREGAKAVFGVSVLLMGYFSSDKRSSKIGPGAPSTLPPADPPAAANE